MGFARISLCSFGQPGCLRLLYHVGQLVRQKPPTIVGRGGESASAEDDMLANRVRMGADLARRVPGSFVAMHANLGKIMVKPLRHVPAQRGVERLARTVEYLVHAGWHPLRQRARSLCKALGQRWGAAAVSRMYRPPPHYLIGNSICFLLQRIAARAHHTLGLQALLCARALRAFIRQRRLGRAACAFSLQEKATSRDRVGHEVTCRE